MFGGCVAVKGEKEFDMREESRAAASFAGKSIERAAFDK